MHNPQFYVSGKRPIAQKYIGLERPSLFSSQDCIDFSGCEGKDTHMSWCLNRTYDVCRKVWGMAPTVHSWRPAWTKRVPFKKNLLYYKSALDQSLIHFWSSVVNCSAFNAGLLMTELQNNLHFTIWIKLISFKELCLIVLSTMGDILGQVMYTCIWKL